MSVFGEEVDKAAEAMSKATVKAKEFEGKGLTLQFKGVEKIKSQYGAEEGANIVEKGILEEGEQFLFRFVDREGLERKHYSTSMPFFIAVQQAEINEGDWLHIERTGVKDKTRYSVEVTKEPTRSTAKAKEPQSDIGEGIPFK